MKPLISVIAASFNSEKVIQTMLDSILAQDFRDMAVLIVDGGSTDKTLEIIEAYQQRFIDKGIGFDWISEKDKGIYDAWNKGLKRANGRWITFIGTDDILLPGALHKMAEMATANPDADFITAKTRMVKNGNVERVFGTEWKWPVFKKEMKILHAGGWHNAFYFKKYGLFDDSFRIAGDYEILLRAGESLHVVFIDNFIIEMGAEGVSSTQVEPALREALRAKIKNRARSVLMARVDYYIVLFKIIFRKYVRKMD